MELAMERVMRAVDASLTTLYILTSPNMHKRVYLEDVIDRVVIFTKYQLLNTIFPSFDPVYRDIKDKGLCQLKCSFYPLYIFFVIYRNWKGQEIMKIGWDYLRVGSEYTAKILKLVYRLQIIDERLAPSLNLALCYVQP